ncbi:hypothetical protein SNEBB_002171 [Seison nebaliae]|nr:hypothetical protein SNEBB_002171 [Seison nebaliae]
MSVVNVDTFSEKSLVFYIQTHHHITLPIPLTKKDILENLHEAILKEVEKVFETNTIKFRIDSNKKEIEEDERVKLSFIIDKNENELNCEFYKLSLFRTVKSATSYLSSFFAYFNVNGMKESMENYRLETIIIPINYFYICHPDDELNLIYRELCDGMKSQMKEYVNQLFQSIKMINSYEHKITSELNSILNKSINFHHYHITTEGKIDGIKPSVHPKRKNVNYLLSVIVDSNSFDINQYLKENYFLNIDSIESIDSNYKSVFLSKRKEELIDRTTSIIKCNSSNHNCHNEPVLLLNIHEHVNDLLKNDDSDDDYITGVIQGDYLYYHYCQDKTVDDVGWACAYRSLQTLCSWYYLKEINGRQLAIPPSIKQIQKILSNISDFGEKIVNSREWIGSTEVGLVLTHYLKNDFIFRILHLPSPVMFMKNARGIIKHFNENGPPIMVGGNRLAHTILGMRLNVDNGQIDYLILDPHYKGNDVISEVVKNKGVRWVKQDFWNAQSFYNICIPSTNE